MRIFTDSAGTTCRYTPIEDLKPHDVVIIGWRTTVDHVEVEGNRARVWWKHRGYQPRSEGQVRAGMEELPAIPDQWNPLGTEMPVEVTDG